MSVCSEPEVPVLNRSHTAGHHGLCSRVIYAGRAHSAGVEGLGLHPSARNHPEMLFSILYFVSGFPNFTRGIFGLTYSWKTRSKHVGVELAKSR